MFSFDLICLNSNTMVLQQLLTKSRQFLMLFPFTGGK